MENRAKSHVETTAPEALTWIHVKRTAGVPFAASLRKGVFRMSEPARPHSRKSRELLDIVIEARMQYAEYLRAVAGGEHPANPEEQKRLKASCDEALSAWRDIHDAWRDSNWMSRNPAL
jgi:hypothetical protein